MALHGELGDRELVCNLAVPRASSDVLENFALTRREDSEPFARLIAQLRGVDCVDHQLHQVTRERRLPPHGTPQ